MKCEKLFDTVNLEQLIEQAGAVEHRLNQIILTSANASEVHRAAQQLSEVELVIQSLLESDSPPDLNQLSLQLDYLGELHKAADKVLNVSSAQPQFKITILKKAEKDIAGLQKHLQVKFAIFLEELSRIKSPVYLSHSWSLERIEVREVTSLPTYSVRLNRGYRVVFTYDQPRGLVILRVSMKITHEH